MFYGPSGYISVIGKIELFQADRPPRAVERDKQGATEEEHGLRSNAAMSVMAPREEHALDMHCKAPTPRRSQPAMI